MLCWNHLDPMYLFEAQGWGDLITKDRTSTLMELVQKHGSKSIFICSGPEYSNIMFFWIEKN